jgi:propionyl-CoA synthetase
MPNTYAETYARWRADPAAFWIDAARAIEWSVPPTQAFDPDSGPYGRWFPDAVGNTCHNAVDRHVRDGHGDRAAIRYDSPVTGQKRTITYNDLLAEVQATAAILQDHGIRPGDRVLIYLPMIPEALVGMLACARIGAVHSVVFGGFAAPELATRIDDATPTVILSASCGIEPTRVIAYKPLLDEAIRLATHKPTACIILQRPQAEAAMTPGQDHDWAALRQAAFGRTVPCVPMQATDPLYILYTSGTTGRPKGVVRDTGGHMVVLMWTMHAIYDMQPGQTFWAASDVGWVVGHSYIVYAPLLAGCTTILYEGKPVGTPDAGAFWRVVQEYDVRVLFTAPTAIRAIRKQDPEAKLLTKYQPNALNALFLAGERADPDTLHWAERVLGLPVIDHWWQTETGWPIAANPLGIEALPVKPGSPTLPMPGYDVAVLDIDGRPVPPGTMGTIAIRLPLPPGALPTLWNAEQRFHDSYLSEFPGYYSTSDAGYADADGYLFVMGRTDDVINVAGHRLSTGAMEEVVALHPAVAECAVIGVHDALKGEAPCGFVILKDGIEADPDTIRREIVTLVRDTIGPVAAFQRVIIVDRLPKTRSGKILRATMKRIVQNEPYTMPATIEDPAALDEISRATTTLRPPA